MRAGLKGKRPRRGHQWQSQPRTSCHDGRMKVRREGGGFSAMTFGRQHTAKTALAAFQGEESRVVCAESQTSSSSRVMKVDRRRHVI